MRAYSDLGQVAKTSVRGRVVAIGVFDGVHLGHQSILRSAVAAAQRLGGPSAVVTFYPHPESVLHSRSAPLALTSPSRKAELLEFIGIEEVVTVKFDREFAGLSPEAFCSRVLSDRLGAQVVFVGENFRFGRQGAGTSADLVAYGRAHGFEVECVPLVEEGGAPVSSTRIRDLLRVGGVSQAAKLLGRPHRVEGTVVTGEGRGRTLQAPTANLAVPRETALPRLGVYASYSTVGGERKYPSVTSVGTNPTFESTKKVRVETLLLDFEGDLYGAQVAVDFLERIRAQKTFPDARALAERIGTDIEIARGMHRRDWS